MSHATTPQNPTQAAIVWNDPTRAGQFARWLTAAAVQHGLQPDSLCLASADASFRRYFRIDAQDGSRIIMDAPPDKENSAPFVKVAALMHAAGVHAPQVLAWDEPLGFMLLTDLGTQTMMQVINREQPQANLPLYLQAVDALIAWQLSSQPDVLPPYDEALLRRELALFPDWYISRHKGVVMDDAMRQTLDKSFEEIIRHNLRWPSVFVHRDFMPRNLMAGQAPTDPLGVLDFQDAVYGPITYDIASLMRDAFLSWDEDFCLDVTIRYWEKARQAGLPVGDDFGEFYRGVEWMGLQRHLKVAGIFARLTLRDGKPQYLADTPRFITYIRATCARYRELKPLLRLVEKVEGIEEPAVFGFGRQ
ncbi:phosphotransferase [Rhodoferax sp.]|uniref:aminoglycoside phosphotransferase family protein n=1 Tax=Rhodoferax sp. TaxID=50421 RepID=UPI0025D870F4|nr:phosphotransferase [Rhodoferax sp.]MCM2342912.1 phosphotransferase [Rhodoferax sp.]